MSLLLEGYGIPFSTSARGWARILLHSAAKKEMNATQETDGRYRRKIY